MRWLIQLLLINLLRWLMNWLLNIWCSASICCDDFLKKYLGQIIICCRFYCLILNCCNDSLIDNHYCSHYLLLDYDSIICWLFIICCDDLLILICYGDLFIINCFVINWLVIICCDNLLIIHVICCDESSIFNYLLRWFFINWYFFDC